MLQQPLVCDFACLPACARSSQPCRSSKCNCQTPGLACFVFLAPCEALTRPETSHAALPTHLPQFRAPLLNRWVGVDVGRRVFR